MRVSHAETTPFTAVRPARGGTIEFKTMLEGAPGTPGNYHLLIANTDISFKSPRHRHNFDQLRYSLEGPTHTGDNCILEEGDLAYFPEGTYYGPQDQQATGKSSLTMVIQFGGPSGSGFMTRAELDRAYDELKEVGRFEEGIYKRDTQQVGERKNQDAYEAQWEHHNKRKLKYNKPRFAQAVQFRESNFEWVPLKSCHGVATKHIGTFTESMVGVKFIQLQSGTHFEMPRSEQTRLLFVKTGTGQLSTGQLWSQYTSIHLDPEDSLALTATSLTELLVTELPLIYGNV